MNEILFRIREVFVESGKTQTEIGRMISKTSQYVWKLLNDDKSNPSDSVIKDICREFDVNEAWLRTGAGNMRKKRLPQDEVASYTEELLDHKEEENPFYDIIIEMIHTYYELDEVSKQAALNYFRLLKKNLEQKKED